MKKTAPNEKVLLGRRIRSLRTTKGLTQEELGIRADVSYKFIGDIERGNQNPSFNTLVKIATALEIELPELFRFDHEINDKQSLESRIASIVKAMPAEKLKNILLLLRTLYPIK